MLPAASTGPAGPMRAPNGIPGQRQQLGLAVTTAKERALGHYRGDLVVAGLRSRARRLGLHDGGHKPDAADPLPLRLTRLRILSEVVERHPVIGDLHGAVWPGDRP